jgi:hypothetical protein
LFVPGLSGDNKNENIKPHTCCPAAAETLTDFSRLVVISVIFSREKTKRMNEQLLSPEKLSP